MAHGKRTKAKKPPKARKPPAPRARAQKKAPPPRPPMPPGFPFPCDDPLLGQTVRLRDCRGVPGKKRKRCDTKAMVPVFCAQPPADHPRRKDLFMVPQGRRYIVPSREVSAAERASAKHRAREAALAAMPVFEPRESCSSWTRKAKAGATLPPEVRSRCARAVDAEEAAAMQAEGAGELFDVPPFGNPSRRAFPNPSPAGWPPGAPYMGKTRFSGRSVVGEDFAGQVIGPATPCPGGRGPHVMVGGMAVPRSRVAAAIRRQELREAGLIETVTGEVVDLGGPRALPAPPPRVSRPCPDCPPTIPFGPRGARGPGRSPAFAVPPPIVEAVSDLPAWIPVPEPFRPSFGSLQGAAVAPPGSFAAFVGSAALLPVASFRHLKRGQALDPNTVYRELRNDQDRPLAVVGALHDGTREGIVSAATAVANFANAQGHDWSNIQRRTKSRTLATDASGEAAWAISPNLAHVVPVGTSEAAYILGSTSLASWRK